MSQFVQSLESRHLMSVTSATLNADAAAILSQSLATKIALVSVKASETAAGSSTIAALKQTNLPSTKAANNKLASILKRTGITNFAKVQRAESGLISTAKSHAAAAAVHGKALLAHPTRVALQKSVAKDEVALNTLVAAKLATLQTVLQNATDAINAVYAQISAAQPTLATLISTNQATVAISTTAFSAAADLIASKSAAFAVDLTNPVFVSTATLTDITFFRGDGTGTNLGATSQINFGAWSSELDVQNVPGNYGAEFFISKVPNPTASDFLTPGTLSAALTSGANTFYFWADSDDTNGGSNTFGLNIYLNGASQDSPSISGYTIPGTGQALNADSASTTAGFDFAVVNGAGTLTFANGTSGTVTLSNFQVQGVAGQNSTVDLVNSTNTAPFAPPAHADNIPDTYGTFTLTVSP